MDLLSTFSDDQLALLGCFTALLVCGAMMSLSFHFGVGTRRSAADSMARTHAFPRKRYADAPSSINKAA